MKSPPQIDPTEDTNALPVGHHETIRRVNRAMDCIDERLAEPLNVSQLAAIANFSAYHFVRVFDKVTGETPAEYLRRIRLERAARLLYLWPRASILDVALAAGFQSAAVFARAFRVHFSMSATAWRRGDFWRPCGSLACWREASCNECENAGEWFGKHARPPALDIPPNLTPRPPGLEDIQLQNIPPRRIAYMRTRGPLEATIPLWQRMVRWVSVQGKQGMDTVLVGQLLEDANITAPRHWRYDVGLIVDDSFVPDRYVNVRKIRGGQHLTATFTGRASDTILALRYLWFVSVPAAGCIPTGAADYCCISYRDNAHVGEPHADSVFRWTFYLPMF